MERWKKIKDFSDYMISNLGRVKSLKTNKIMTIYTNKKGYSQIKLFKDSKHHSKYVHLLVGEAFLKGFKPGLEINHKDGNKSNNAVTNLEWITHADNIKHAIKNGLFTPYKLPPRPHEGKKVRIVETGEVFDSLTKCAEHIGGFKTAISACLLGKVKTHKGFHFEEV